MKNLAAKMVKVLGAVSGKVSKSGKNTHQGYKYVMESDLLDAVRSELITHGVFVFSSVEEVTQEGKLTTVKTKHTFVDSESGETFDVFSAGQGSDGRDKGVYKAITGASKYFLMKSFMVAGDDDPENETASKPLAKKPAAKTYTKPAEAAAKPKSTGGFGKKSTASFGTKKKTEPTETQEAKTTGGISLDDIPF